MLSSQFFSGMAIFMSLLAYAFYVYSIYKGKSQPHVFSWLSWFIVMAVGGLAQGHMDEDGGSSLVLYITAGCYLSIAVYAAFMKNKNITASDTYTFIGALCAIPMWLITKDPLAALCLLMAIDVLSFYPTIRKTYYKPYSEDLTAYTLAAFAYGFMIFAIETPNAQNLVYPVFLTGLEFGFVAFVVVVRKMRGRPAKIQLKQSIKV